MPSVHSESEAAVQVHVLRAEEGIALNRLGLECRNSMRFSFSVLFLPLKLLMLLVLLHEEGGLLVPLLLRGVGQVECPSTHPRLIGRLRKGTL